MPLLLFSAATGITSFSRVSRVVIGLAGLISTLLLLSRLRGTVQQELVEQHVIKQTSGVYRISKGPPPSVNLVVVATSKENYGWVKDLKVPGIVVVPYIADNTSAPYHTKKNKGHEAIMYY
jgi:hypothetical protein